MIVFLILSLMANVAAGYGLYRLTRRLFQFEDVLHAIIEDVDSYVDFLGEVVDRPTFSNSPEVMAFAENMKEMRKRMAGHSEAVKGQLGEGD